MNDLSYKSIIINILYNSANRQANNRQTQVKTDLHGVVMMDYASNPSGSFVSAFVRSLCTDLRCGYNTRLRCNLNHQAWLSIASHQII